MRNNANAIVPLILGAGHATRNAASCAGALITKNVFIPNRRIAFSNTKRTWDAESFISTSGAHMQRLDRVYGLLLQAAHVNRNNREMDISDTFDAAADHYIYVRDPKYYRTKASEIAPDLHSGEVCSLILTMACVLSVIRYTTAQDVEVLFIPERVNNKTLEFVDTVITALNGRECTQGAAVSMITANAFFTQTRVTKGPSRYTDGWYDK